MEFTVSVVYDRRDLAALVRAVRAVSVPRAFSLLCRVLRLGLGLWLLYAAARTVSLCGEGLTRELSVAGVWSAVVLPVAVLTLLGGYLTARGVTDRAPLQERRAWRAYSGKGQQLTFHFTPEGFDEHLANSDHHYTYAAICAIAEDEERYFLFVSRRAAHLLPKAAFTTGGAQNFGACLTQWTGLPVRRV